MGSKFDTKAIRRILFRILVLVLPAVLIFIGVYSIIISEVEDQAYQRLVSEQKEGTRLISDILETTFSQFNSDMQVVFYSGEFTDYLQTPDNWHRDRVEQLFMRIGVRKPYIRQLRFIDKLGHEEIRVNNKNGTSSPVHKEELQDKSNRDYVCITSTLPPGSVYVSNMELNVEYGETVMPYEPVLRMAMPAYRDAEFVGIVIINYDANYLLSFFSSYLSSLLKDLSFGLIDNDGNWIIRNNEYVFGFNFDKTDRNNLFVQEPGLKQAIENRGEGAAEIAEQTYFFHSILPVPASDVPWYPGGDRLWTAVSFFNKDELPALDRNFLLNNPQIMWILAFVIFATGVGLVFLSYVRGKDRQQMKISALVSEYTHDGVIITDKDTRITFCNKSFEELSGYGRDEIIGRKPSFLSIGSQASVLQQGEKEGVSSFSWKGEIWNVGKQGHYFLTNLLVTEIRDYRGKPEYYVGLYAQSKWEACEPGVRTVDNADLLFNQKHSVPFSCLHGKIEKGKHFCCLVLQIANYNKIEMMLNPGESYVFISDMVNILTAWIDPTDSIAVYAPDTYFLTVSDCLTEDSLQQKMSGLLNRLESYTLDNISTELITICGISGYPEHGTTPKDLFSKACMAKDLLEGAKTACFQLYNQEIYTMRMRRNLLLQSIPESMSNGEFELYYQPQVSITTNRIIGAEALIRWNSPRFGYVPPDEFVPLMEQNGLIELLGKHVIHESIGFLKSYGTMLRNINTSFSVAINLTAGELMNQSVIDMIKNELSREHVDPKSLTVEITERTVMEDFEKANATLKELRNMGISIAIDDFGTGFSSLSYLLKLNMDKFKIDRAFIKNYPNEDTIILVKAIIHLGKELDITVIAEGVETEQQREFLQTLGCDQYQGYLYSKAIPAMEFIKLVSQQKVL